MSPIALRAVVGREIIRLMRQRSRLLSAIVRPLIWLLVIGAGVGSVLGGAGQYQHALLPGVLGMTLLFGAILAALTTVYDKESGFMRLLLVGPFDRYWVIIAKTLAAVASAVLQALLLLVVLAALGWLSPEISVAWLMGGMFATAFACAGIGMLVATFSQTLENFAAMMNFVIFPAFFLSGSLYPVSRLPAWLQVLARINPYSYGVDLLKHAMALPQPGYAADFDPAVDALVLAGFTIVALTVACWRFDRETVYSASLR